MVPMRFKYRSTDGTNTVLDANPKAADKTHSKIGGFAEQVEFEPKRRILPKVLQIDLVQQLTLMSVYDALEDAFRPITPLK